MYFYYNIRHSENILHVPKPIRTDYLKRSLGYSEAVLWKGLPSELHVRKPLTVTRFKKGIKITYTHQWAPIWQTRKPVL